jgi:type VI secretion system secreted protein VgrG
MSATATAIRYLLKIGSLDTSKVSVLRFDLVEKLSTPFELRIDFASAVADLAFDKTVGKPAKLSIDESGRVVNGIVHSLEVTGQTASRTLYRAVIVPPLALLAHRSTRRMFHQQPADRIVAKVLQGMNLAEGDDFQFNLNDPCPAREYCVQFGETDSAFISRLLEEEGIFYFFQCQGDKCSVVFADSQAASSPIDGDARLRFAPDSGMAAPDEYVSDFTARQTVGSGQVQVNDYRFDSPRQDLVASVTADHPPVEGLAQYHYPGNHLEKAQGKHVAQLRVEEAQVRRLTSSGISNCPRLSAGFTFELFDHPRKDVCGKYLITAARHRGSHPQSAGEDSIIDDEPIHQCEFSVITTKIPFRPPLVTPRAIVRGVHTAVVVGEGEVDVDAMARILVRFHWDPTGDSSCRVRVGHSMSGAAWGAVFIPRVGQEVLVQYVEGDPDRPIVVGTVYNGDNRPPYSQGQMKSVNGVKTNSTPGGGGFNEIRLADTAGTELLYVQAQKDRQVLVKNNNGETVGANETISVGKDQTITVGQNQTESVGANRTDSVGANESTTIGVNQTLLVKALRTHTVGINDMLNVGAAQEITVGAARAVTVGGAQAVSIGLALVESVGGSRTESCGGNLSETVGANHTANVAQSESITIGQDGAFDVGKHFTIVAGDQIVLKTGDASIIMKKDGSIQIKGKDISIEGSGNLVVKASGKMTMKASQISQN